LRLALCRQRPWSGCCHDHTDVQHASVQTRGAAQREHRGNKSVIKTAQPRALRSSERGMSQLAEVRLSSGGALDCPSHNQFASCECRCTHGRRQSQKRTGFARSRFRDTGKCQECDPRTIKAARSTPPAPVWGACKLTGATTFQRLLLLLARLAAAGAEMRRHSIRAATMSEQSEDSQHVTDVWWGNTVWGSPTQPRFNVTYAPVLPDLRPQAAGYVSKRNPGRAYSVTTRTYLAATPQDES